MYYSSLTLLAMGCLAFAISLFFRLKSRAVKRIPDSLAASIFSKTFNVFDPYQERRRIIHSFLFILPILVFFAAFGAMIGMLKLLEYGFLLSLFMVIICLNLIVVEVAPEVYGDSNSFLNAFERRTELGVGDVKVLNSLRRALPRLSNYYLGLSIVFVALAATFDYVWSLMLWSLASAMRPAFETGVAVAELSGWLISLFVTIFLFAGTLVLIQLVLRRVKSKFLTYLV